jgi:hypothetical protein
MSKTEMPLVREAVAVFQNEKDLQSAADELLSHGFHRSELSLLASTSAVDQKLGHQFRSVSRLEDEADIPTIAYASTEAIGDAEGAIIGSLMYVGALIGLVPVVASGGTLAGALVAMTVSGGGAAAIGTALAGLIGKHHADHIEDQLGRGGLLLWVRTWNPGDENWAVEILKKHSGQDVHVHGLPDSPNASGERVHESKRSNEELTYKGISYSEAGPSEFYVSGKLFSSEAEVKAYIDRHTYLEKLYQKTQIAGFDLESAMADPAAAFETPAKLVSSSLSDPAKLELLKRWAYNAKQLELAADEGMPEPADGGGLKEIEDAIDRLIHTGTTN